MAAMILIQLAVVSFWDKNRLAVRRELPMNGMLL